MQALRLETSRGSEHLEIEWTGSADASPGIVFLHEGLGSVGAWRDFPDELCAAAWCHGLVYSRRGYGRSTRRAAGERWGADHLEHEAVDVLPRVLHAAHVDSGPVRPWLYGHSDGATIALIAAARFPDAIGGVIAEAPHVMVEDPTLEGIRATLREYESGGRLRQALARYHADPDSAFYGWSGMWLAPEFRAWSIEPLLAQIRCPVLAIQGTADPYGTLVHVDAIRQRVASAEVLATPGIGHAPHREDASAVIRAAAEFIATNAR